MEALQQRIIQQVITDQTKEEEMNLEIFLEERDKQEEKLW